jgi:hypothetical protein
MGFPTGLNLVTRTHTRGKTRRKPTGYPYPCNTLITVDSASQQRAVKPLPPAVKDAYQKALEYLRQTSGPKSKPKLYEVLQTFWIPQKANFFLLHGKSKPCPEQLYNYRWFYWDPDHLVEGGLKCPNCNNPLDHHGFTRPRRVVDLEDVYYMIGQRHLCRHC